MPAVSPRFTCCCDLWKGVIIRCCLWRSQRPSTVRSLSSTSVVVLLSYPYWYCFPQSSSLALFTLSMLVIANIAHWMAQTKNCPFWVNTTIQLKNITWWWHATKPEVLVFTHISRNKRITYRSTDRCLTTRSPLDITLNNFHPLPPPHCLLLPATPRSYRWQRLKTLLHKNSVQFPPPPPLPQISDKSGHPDVTAQNIIGLLNTQFTVIAKTKAFRLLLTISSKANSSCKASGCSAVKKFPSFYKARKLTTVFIRVCHCVISLISKIHSIYKKKIGFNITLPSIATFRSPLLVSSLHVYNQRIVHILHLSLHGACSGYASSHKNVFTAAANGMTTSLSPPSSPPPSYHSNTTGIITGNSAARRKERVSVTAPR